MKIHTRKNSAVGYLTLKALQRAIDKKSPRDRRSSLKVAAFVGLGLVSAGILAAALAIALRRRQGGAVDVAAFDEGEIVGEYVTTPEPVPAT